MYVMLWIFHFSNVGKLVTQRIDTVKTIDGYCYQKYLKNGWFYMTDQNGILQRIGPKNSTKLFYLRTFYQINQMLTFYDFNFMKIIIKCPISTIKGRWRSQKVTFIWKLFLRPSELIKTIDPLSFGQLLSFFFLPKFDFRRSRLTSCWPFTSTLKFNTSDSKMFIASITCRNEWHVHCRFYIQVTDKWLTAKKYFIYTFDKVKKCNLYLIKSMYNQLNNIAF